jgi:hypothetical protein
MNKILAMDPSAIDSVRDWEKIYPFIEHAKGIFIANYPRKWAQKFINQIDTSDWGFWDQKKIEELLIYWESTNTFVSLNSPYDDLLNWSVNYSKANIDTSHCISFGSRKLIHGLKTLDELDPNQLFLDSTIFGKFTSIELVKLLKLFLQNAGKLALIDRHNYLIKTNGEIHPFVIFVRHILSAIKSSKCYEIIIYARHDPDKYPYMKSNETVYEQLKKSFEECITPLHGVRYICCSEYANNQDLHARRIITNNVVFLLSDSIAGHNFSQSITRVHDKNFREKNLKDWIDGDHGLAIKSEATYINLKKN